MSRRHWLAAGAALAGYAMAAAPSLAQAVRTDEAGLATAQAEIMVGDVLTMQAAARVPGLRAAVAWYGAPTRPFPADGGPVTGFDDMRRFIDLARTRNPNVEMVVYPNAGHAFHADYRPSYLPAAAAAAWEKCLQFFARHLRA